MSKSCSSCKPYTAEKQNAEEVTVLCTMVVWSSQFLPKLLMVSLLEFAVIYRVIEKDGRDLKPL